MTKRITEEMRQQALVALENGASRADVAKAWGVGYTTWWKYLKKNLAFADQVDDACDAHRDHVEDSIGRRALGMEVTERHTIRKQEGGVVNDKGELIGGRVTVEVRTIVKQLPPDVTACMYLLNNLRSSKYGKQVSPEMMVPPSVTLVMNVVSPPEQIGGVVVDALPGPAAAGEEGEKK